MSNRFLIAAGTLAAVIAMAVLAAVPAAGQAQDENSYTVSRTPWGDPDFQGSWENRTPTPLERAAEFGTREFMTEEEAAARANSRVGLPDGEEGSIADDLPGPEDLGGGIQRVLERAGESAPGDEAHVADRGSTRRPPAALHARDTRDVGRTGSR